MKKVTLLHKLGNKIIEYDVDSRGIIIDEREATALNKNYKKWIKEHMVFWYDMSKPVDTYAENFNDWTKYTVNANVAITSTTLTITRFTTPNDVVKCYIPNETKNFPGMKVTIEGILDGQELYWGYSANVKLIEITSDGTYDIPPLETVNGNLSFRNGNIAGACNITITQLPSGQSIPTNEILKANPYLQDHSENDRQLKLNNFLFAAMSGVGRYSLNAKSYHNRASTLEGMFNNYSIVITAKVKDILGLVWTENGIGDSNSVAVGKTLTRPAFTVTVEGMPDDLKWGLYEDNVPINKGNGTFEIPAYTYTNTTETMQSRFIGITFNQNTFNNVNIKFTFQPLYPNSLVTDGVDDYGQVQNLQQGVKMLFMTVNPLALYKTWYVQDNFSIYGQPGNIAYNFRNTGGVTYLDGILNETEVSNNLLRKKRTVIIVNPTDGNDNNIIFFNSYGSSYMQMAFYNSIGFDSVPTKETDGFTELDLIDYVLENIITQ